MYKVEPTSKDSHRSLGNGRSVAMILSDPLTSRHGAHNGREAQPLKVNPDPRIVKEGQALLKRGFKVTVFAWDREGSYSLQEGQDGIDIQRIQVKTSYDRGIYQMPAATRFYREVFRRLKHSRFDIVHCNDLETLPVGFLAKRLMGLKVIFDAHEPNYFSDSRRLRGLTVAMGRLMERVMERVMVPRVDGVMVTNQHQVKKYIRLGAKEVWLVPNYPEESLINSRLPQREEGCITIGRIGALVDDTGVEELVDAYELLRRRYSNLRLLIAGGGWDQDYIQALSRRVNSLEGGTFIPGYDYSALADLYRQIDISAMPYHRTLWFKYITPVKFFEALCFGTPVITTDIGGIGRIVREEQCGILVDRVTPDSVAKALEELILKPASRREMGDRGRKAIIEKYNWDKSLEGLLEAYSSVASVDQTLVH